jgi:CHAT domain-containing protein
LNFCHFPYHLIVLFILTLSSFQTLFAQLNRPNLTDNQGRKQGEWSFFMEYYYDRHFGGEKMDGDYDYRVYRIVNYENGKIKGKIRHYTEEGKILMEIDSIYAVEFLTDDEEENKLIINGKREGYHGKYRRYQMVDLDTIPAAEVNRYKGNLLAVEAEFRANEHQGKVIFYYPEGTKKSEQTFEQGVAKEDAFIFERDGSARSEDWGDLHNRAITAFEMGNFTQASSYYPLALKQAEKEFGKESFQYHNTLGRYALLLWKMGDYNESEKCFQAELNFFGKNYGLQSVRYAERLDFQAEYYENIGYIQRAESYYLKALQICKDSIATTGKECYEKTINNLAVFYSNAGRDNEAEKFLLEYASLSQKAYLKDSSTYKTKYVQALNNLAGIQVNLGKFKEAEVHIKDGMKVLLAQYPFKNHIYFPFLQISHLKCLMAAGDSVKAKALSETLYQKYANAESIEPRDLNVIFQLSQHLNFFNPSQAEYLLRKIQQALPKFSEENSALTTIIRHNLACNQYLQKKYSEAEKLSLQNRDYYVGFLQNRFPYLSESEKQAIYQNEVSYFFEFFNSLALSRYKTNLSILGDMYNHQLLTKALFFEASNQVRAKILSSGDTILIQKYKTWQAQKLTWLNAQKLSPAQREAANLNLNELQLNITELERNLTKEVAQFSQNQLKTPITWQMVQKRLKVNEVAIEIIRFRGYNLGFDDEQVKYAALILRPNTKNQPELVLLENGYELERKYLNNYRNSIQAKKADKYSYRQYWQQIAEKLAISPTGTGKLKVYFSPDGVYNQLNLNTLQNPTTSKYLGEEIDIQLVNNTKDILPYIEPLKKIEIKSATLFGFPDFNNLKISSQNKSKDEERRLSLTQSQANKKGIRAQRFFSGENITELPGTKIEIENIEKILTVQKIQTKRYSFEQATENEIKKLQNPQILHIATHGFFLSDLSGIDERGLAGIQSQALAQNPLLRSGLLLANCKQSLNTPTDNETEDGIFTAYEAMNLNLDNTDLVVLSACETGLGEIKNGEGVYGLQRAFQQAGAKTVLMSLWTVSDEATQELMTLFYQNYITKKQAKRLAFQNAQNELKKKFPEPYYWGAFVMVGE